MWEARPRADGAVSRLVGLVAVDFAPVVAPQPMQYGKSDEACYRTGGDGVDEAAESCFVPSDKYHTIICSFLQLHATTKTDIIVDIRSIFDAFC